MMTELGNCSCLMTIEESYFGVTALIFNAVIFSHLFMVTLGLGNPGPSMDLEDIKCIYFNINFFFSPLKMLFVFLFSVIF